MPRSYRILIFADPRRMGKEAYECYRAWCREHDDGNILWVGYSVTDSDVFDLALNGRRIAFDPEAYDESAKLLEGKGWRILPRANALIIAFDSDKGRSIDIRDLGSFSNQFVRKLQAIVDEMSAPVSKTGQDAVLGEVALEGAYFTADIGLDTAPDIIAAIFSSL